MKSESHPPRQTARVRGGRWLVCFVSFPGLSAFPFLTEKGSSGWGRGRSSRWRLWGFAAAFSRPCVPPALTPGPLWGDSPVEWSRGWSLSVISPCSCQISVLITHPDVWWGRNSSCVLAFVFSLWSATSCIPYVLKIFSNGCLTLVMVFYPGLGF